MQQYIVVRGDNLSKIARRNGLKSWRDIYYHFANSHFRQKRTNPNLIHPGDVLQIPHPHEVKKVPKANRQIRHQELPNVDADEADLRTAALDNAKDTIRKDKELSGSNWLTHVIRYLTQAATNEAERLQQKGVRALVFGKAGVRKHGQHYAPRAELEGIQIQINPYPKEQQHNGTQLFSGDRVSTFDGGDAIVLFLDDFTTVRLRENRELIIIKTSSGPARRKTSSAVLERGTLKHRLRELDGR